MTAENEGKGFEEEVECAKQDCGEGTQRDTHWLKCKELYRMKARERNSPQNRAIMPLNRCVVSFMFFL
jgi:hypothetical protein